MQEIVNHDKKYPEVHIFFICYNKLWFTRKTLQSILKTEYHNLVLHIFNNGSIDNGETSEYFDDFFAGYKPNFPIDYLKLDIAIPFVDLRFKFLKTFQLLYPNFNYVAEIHNNLNITNVEWLTLIMDMLQSTKNCCLIQSTEGLRDQKNLEDGNGILYESKNPVFENFLSKKPKDFEWDQFIKNKLKKNYIVNNFSSMTLLDNIDTDIYQNRANQHKDKITYKVKKKSNFNKKAVAESVKVVRKKTSSLKVKPRNIKQNIKVVKKLSTKKVKDTEVIKIQPRIWRNK